VVLDAFWTVIPLPTNTSFFNVISHFYVQQHLCLYRTLWYRKLRSIDFIS
jgi:hypothetical protein